MGGWIRKERVRRRLRRMVGRARMSNGKVRIKGGGEEG